MAAALHLDEYWRRSSAVAGPIDVVDLFSGCGGMSAGFRAFNGAFPAFRIAAAVDIDAVANRTYAANLGVVPSAESVVDLRRRSTLLQQVVGDSRRRGHPLVLIGCAPCQGFSSHRNAAGVGDERNSLFVDFAAVAAKLRPDAVVVENVPELMTDLHWPHVVRARAILERAGYRTHLSVHNMAEYGVPQQRFRTLLLAFRRRFNALAPFVPAEAFRTVRQAIGALPHITAGERDRNDPMHRTAGHRESTLATIRAVPRNGGSRPPDVGPECLRRIHEAQGKPGYEDVYGRLYWDRPAITITGSARNPASGRFVHPEQDRALSIREAALLQGFPRAYHFEGTLDECFRQIGNAVPPTFAAYLAGHLVGELLGGAAQGRPDRGVVTPVGPSFARMIPGIKASGAAR
jgi:DNA (cytosine-5)-methyltransferase 1